MPDREYELGAVQRWMQAVIMHEGGVQAGLASAAAREQIDVAPGDVGQIISRSQALSSVERLSIYAGAYYARLLECLGEEFPVLKQTLGAETFDGFAFGYLQAYPSRSYTLGHLGANFARFLSETRPADADWPDFLIDLATLEWTFSQVFDGPGVEGKPLLDVAALGAIPPDRWGEVRLEMVPCFKLLALRFPVNAFYAAARHGETPPLPEPADSWLAITRRDFIVRRHELSRPQFELLSALLAGEPLKVAIARALEASDADPQTFVAALGDWFRTWAAEGFFAGHATAI